MKEKTALAGALSKRLASRHVSDELVRQLTDDLVTVGKAPIGVDICPYGICFDYFVDRSEVMELLEGLRHQPHLGEIKLFPKGILDPTKFLVQVERAIAR